jgi:ATP-binding cassette subfamily F protein 3
MTLVSLSNIAIQYGADVLLRDVQCTIAAGDRWGLVGRNGSGKTSLFRVITGEQAPSAGGVARAPGLRLAVLDQHRDFAGAETVWDAACAPYAELLALEHSLKEQGEAIALLGERLTEAHLNRYDRDLERFRREGGYEMEARVSAVLHGLGFDPERARTQALATLSGGERGRLGLACQLVADADLLLLDEPTNHLDLATTDWLVSHLKGLDAAALIISHDRAFLDAVANHVLHIEAGTTLSYKGGYADFVRQRDERRLAQGRAWQKQARAIAKEEDYIARNIAGQNSNQAKGRRRRLARLPRLSPPPAEEGAMAVRFRPGARGGDQVIVADKLTIAIGDRLLVDRFSGVMRRGDVLGLVGPNGAGKSTFLATLLGDRPPTSGTLRLGDSIDVEVYRQDMAQVPRDKALFDIIHDLRPSWTRGQVMEHLGRFDFPGDTQFRKAASLSGGELARVALAMMTLTHANLLVFDEPTNHLDVESIEALEDAIERFEGSVLLVSHDRALLTALCTRIWHLEDGKLSDFDGGFDEWELQRAEAARRRAEAARRAEEARRARAARGAQSDAQGRKGAQSAGRAARSAHRAAERAVAEAEAAVQEHEAAVAALTTELAEPGLYGTPGGAARARELAQQLEQRKAALAVAYQAWEAAMAEVERLG